MTSRVDTTPPSQRPSLPRRWPWIALASVLVIGSLPWLACPRLKSWRARRDAVEALSRLSDCLFGTDGGRSDAVLRGRLIAAQLERRGTSGEGWPQRCNADAAALHVALEALHQSEDELCDGDRCCLGDEDCANLARARDLLQRLRTALRSGDLPAGLAVPLFEHAAALNLTVDPPPGQVDPPAPAALPTPAAMTPLVRGRYDRKLTAHVEPDGLRVAFHRRAKVVTTCDLQLTTATARCAPAAPAVPVAGELRLPDQAPGTPILLFAETTDPGGARPAGALYRPSDGTRLFDLPPGSLGSYVWHDSAVTSLVRDDETASALLVRQARGKPPEHDQVELPDPLSGGPLLAGDTMLWLTPGRQNDHRLHASRLHALGPLASDARDLGSTGPLPAAPEVETCRLGSTLAVLLRAKPQGYDTRVALALRGAAGWSPVIRAQVPSPWFGFTCHADTASLAWIEARAEEDQTGGAPPAGARPIGGDYFAARLSCTKSGCRKEEAIVPLSRWSRTSRYVIASLGPSAVVLWRSPLGDTRRRTASFGGLPEAPSRALFDDVEHGGFAWEQAGTTLLVRGSSALLLVEAETVAGAPDTYAFVLAQDGTARPVTVTRDAP